MSLPLGVRLAVHYENTPYVGALMIITRHVLGL